MRLIVNDDAPAKSRREIRLLTDISALRGSHPAVPGLAQKNPRSGKR